MFDKNQKEIAVGDFIKKIGTVLYADGLKEKISKKTWLVSDIREGILYQIVDGVEESIEGTDFLVVGNIVQGIKEGYLAPKDLSVSGGSVGSVYRILKEVKSQNWKAGEIVRIHGKVHTDMLEGGILEKIDDNTLHQHMLIVVDPIKLTAIPNELE